MTTLILNRPSASVAVRNSSKVVAGNSVNALNLGTGEMGRTGSAQVGITAPRNTRSRRSGRPMVRVMRIVGPSQMTYPQRAQRAQLAQPVQVVYATETKVQPTATVSKPKPKPAPPKPQQKPQPKPAPQPKAAPQNAGNPPKQQVQPAQITALPVTASAQLGGATTFRV